MNLKVKSAYEFGEFRLIPAERVLTQNGSPVQLPPKAFEILAVLVENAGELVDKKDLLERVWPGSFVEEANIQVQVSAIRKLLGPGQIETVAKKGYRFISPTNVIEIPVRGMAQQAPSPPGDTTEPHSGLHARLGRARWVILLIVIVAGLGIGGYFFASSRASQPFDLSTMRVRKLTNTGASFGAAVSPDGKYIAYEATNGDQFSLWLAEPSTGSQIEIIPRNAIRRSGLIFHPNGDDIYFLASDEQKDSTSNLYRIPRLGGEPVKITSGLNGPIAFSPRGDRFVFVRSDRQNKLSQLITANIDGSGETAISTAPGTVSFSTGKRPAWSPDGKFVCAVGRDQNEQFVRVYLISVTDGGVLPLTSEKWTAVQDVVWLPDSDHILITAQDDRNFGPLQIWQGSVSGKGAPEKVTRELQNYLNLSLDAAGRTLTATQSEGFLNIWTVDPSDPSSVRQVVANKGGGRVDIAWTADGRIVYTSNDGGSPNLFVINADGSGKRQITDDRFDKRSPVAAPDAKSIVYVSSKSGPEQLWRVNLDGGEATMLSTARVYRFPQFSIDGRHVIYTTWDNAAGKATIWKVPSRGGEPSVLKADLPYTPYLSHDLRSVAFLERVEGSPPKLNVVDMNSGSLTHSYEMPQSIYSDSIQWSPDDKSLIYRFSKDFAVNFWMLPVGGSEPKQITPFRFDFPGFCSWSPDMRQIACVRGTLVRDVVLFSASN